MCSSLAGGGQAWRADFWVLGLGGPGLGLWARVLTSCVTRARAPVSPSLRLLICKMARLGGAGSGERLQFCRMRHMKSLARNL